MKVVTIEELLDDTESLLTAGVPLSIERAGVPLALFIPLPARTGEAGRAALASLGNLVEQVIESTGLAEDEFAAELADPASGPSHTRRR